MTLRQRFIRWRLRAARTHLHWATLYKPVRPVQYDEAVARVNKWERRWTVARKVQEDFGSEKLQNSGIARAAYLDLVVKTGEREKSAKPFEKLKEQYGEEQG